MSGRDSAKAAPDPLVLLVLGLVPAAAASARVADTLWMAAGVVSVTILSSLCIALLQRWATDPGASTGAERRENRAAPGAARRWLGALVVSSCLTAVFELVLLVVAPEASASLGIYAPLIAVNCLVLVRAAAASGAGLARAATDGLKSGLGFALCLLLIAIVRESLGAGTITLFPMGDFDGTLVIPLLSADPARALGYAGGALLCLGYLAAVVRSLGRRRQRRARAGEGRP